MEDFDYLGNKEVYLDAACQSLRPRPVVEALERYYYQFNSCGERVKYPWGEKTDELVTATRRAVLKLLKLSAKDYFVSFTLNTTYGVNLLLNEIDPKYIRKVVTSEIEHNSPFLATMALAERLGVPRVVLERDETGALLMHERQSDDEASKKVEARAKAKAAVGAKIKAAAGARTQAAVGAKANIGASDASGASGAAQWDGDFAGALVVVNVAANFDGRQLVNMREVVKKVHRDGGIIILDAAQAMAHAHELLEKTEADAICFSAHKMYAPSLGVMVVRRDLVPKLRLTFIGGGMVDDVFQDRYLLSAENKEHVATIFEPGLQAWGEIIALGEAIRWLEKRTKADKARLAECTKELDEFLRANPRVHMVGEQANPTMSFYIEGLDSHLVGAALGKQGIMARTGYFCAHYYLDKVRHLPPLVRFSLSYANTLDDVARVKKALGKI